VAHPPRFAAHIDPRGRVVTAWGEGPALLERLMRTGSSSRRDIALDVLMLVALGLLLMGAGFGLRDPWPADEPRFALVAQDMLRSGDWLFPRVGGDLYADKPPLYFWLLAASMAITGSVRLGFLLPSLLAGLGTTLLVYDFVRRARGREAALAGGFMLLLTFQFMWQARQAQIDATLCFLTTLSLYGLMRHLVLGPARRWYLAGWAVAGLGVITKGVGFLPLLALVPHALLARRGWPMTAPRSGTLLAGGVGAMLLAIGVWFVPMILVSSAGGELLAYRNEILFRQTVTRYAEAWHHHAPLWFYFVEVVPFLWLPLVALIPWLWPRWREALRTRDTMVAVLLTWVLVVLLFFTASTGKRGVYVLPAVPALAIAAAPWLPEILRRARTRRLAFLLSGGLVLLTAGAALYFTFDADAAAKIVAGYGIRPAMPLACVAIGGLVALVLLRPRDGWLAYGAVLAVAMVTVGIVVSPRIDAVRSGRDFMRTVERASAGIDELGLVGPKEQYLLQLRRPSVNFGHARWREREQEAADAAAWLAQQPGRGLLLDSRALEACFTAADATELARANRQRWLLVTGPPNADCVARGDASRARYYRPPDATMNTGG
jgi:4-amino-4-deoxy-L-arabinose transferase-like glycosyltransferase